MAYRFSSAFFRLPLFSVLVLVGERIAVGDSNWPQFRGPHASGRSEEAAPVSWDVEAKQNILWQTSIPGLGHACPIIWGKRVYVATAIKPSGKPELKLGLYGDGDSYKEKEAHQWRLLSIDKSSGKIEWNKLEYEAVPRLER